jgi:hypothetical protein
MVGTFGTAVGGKMSIHFLTKVGDGMVGGTVGQVNVGVHVLTGVI